MTASSVFRLALSACTSTVLAFLVATAPVAAQSSTSPSAPLGSLLEEVPGVLDSQLQDPLLFDSTAVNIDLGLLDSLDPNGGDVLEIRLGHHATYLAIFDRREKVAATGGHDWFGRLVGLPKSRFILSRVDDSVCATFHPLDGGDKMLRLQPGGGIHFVRALRSGVATCGVTDSGVTTSAPEHPSVDHGSCNPLVPEIRMLCLYTREALLDLQGQVAAVNAQWQNSVAELNQNLRVSGIQGFSCNIATILAVPATFSQTRDMDTDLRNLKTHPTIAAWRRQYRADLVALFVGNQSAYIPRERVGWAEIGKPLNEGGNGQDGFSVNSITWGPDIVPHEIGHNLGACHEDAGCYVTYNRAYRFCGGRVFGTCAVYYKTRMWSVLGSGVVGYYSTPSITWPGGDPIGTSRYNNVARINATRGTVGLHYRDGHYAIDRIGCRGSTVTANASAHPPELGKSLRITGDAPYPGAIVFFGFQSSNWMGLNLPFHWGPLGSPGCYANVSLDLVVGSGTTPFNFQAPLPLDTNLVCHELDFQFLFWNAAAPPENWAWSQRIQAHVGGIR